MQDNKNMHRELSGNGPDEEGGNGWDVLCKTEIDVNCAHPFSSTSHKISEG